MAHNFEFDAVHKVLLCRVHGRVTDESLRGIYLEVRKWSDATEARAGIFDLSPVTSFEVSSATMFALAQEKPAMGDAGTHPRVIVAPTTEIFGMSRMFQIAGAEQRPGLTVVRTLEEAYANLGMQAARFELLDGFGSS